MFDCRELRFQRPAASGRRYCPDLSGPHLVGQCRALSALRRAVEQVETVVRSRDEATFVELMNRGREAGMISLNRSLVQLCRDGLVDEADARHHASNPDEFTLHMRGLYTGVDSLDHHQEVGG